MGLVPGVVRAETADSPAQPASDWKTELVGGLNLTAGNSKTLLLSAGAETAHTHALHEFKADAQYKYGNSTVTDDHGDEVDDTTTKNAKGGMQYNRLLNERLYALFQVTALYDAIASIAYRVVGGPGLGYYLVKRSTQAMALELGVAYLVERVDDISDQQVLFRIAQRYQYEFSAGSKVWQSVEYLPQASDFTASLVNAEVGAQSQINSSVSMRVVLQNRYDSRPADDRDENDLTLTAALVYVL